jgi:hypothetical protein
MIVALLLKNILLLYQETSLVCSSKRGSFFHSQSVETEMGEGIAHGLFQIVVPICYILSLPSIDKITTYIVEMSQTQFDRFMQISWCVLSGESLQTFFLERLYPEREPIKTEGLPNGESILIHIFRIHLYRSLLQIDIITMQCFKEPFILR